MYYAILAYNSQTLYVWSSSTSDVERYIDWLNRDREVNLYTYEDIPAADWPEHENRDDAMSMDEPGWDDFMGAEE